MMWIGAKSRRNQWAGVLSLGVALLVGPGLVSAAQSMRFQRFSVEDGLSQSNVQATLQDNSGLIWFATENGLDRFNGYAFRHHRRDRFSDTALESDFVSDLSIDANGDIWVATDGGGVSRWNARSDDFSNYRHIPLDTSTIADDHLRTILAIDGRVWMGTRLNGLDSLDTRTGQVTHWRHDPSVPTSLSSDEIYDLALGPDGELWVATHKGLNRFDWQTGEARRYYHDAADPQSLSDNTIETVFVDSDGVVWAGTRSGGLNKLDHATGKFERYVHDAAVSGSLSDNRVNAIYEDTDGRFWVGTESGLNLMNRSSGTFAQYRNDPADSYSISGDNIMSVFQDRSGVLWVGTKTNGVNGWNPRSWSFGHTVARPGEPGSISNSLISSFTIDQSDQLWVGTVGGGLNVIDRKSGDIRYINEKTDGLSSDRVMALLTDSGGKVWVGTMGGGLNEIDPLTGVVTTYRHDPNNPASLAADGVMTLFEDSRGRIWAGTFGGGASRLDRQTGLFTNFAPEPGNSFSLSGSRATSILEDSYGIIWVGTDGAGLNALDTSSGHWQNFQHDPQDPSSLSTNTVYTLHLDKKDRLWVGTRASLDSLNRDPKTGAPIGFESITQIDGLANDTVYGIQSDRFNTLWLSTNFGLARYDPKTRVIRNFHFSNGLQGEEFNFGAHYASTDGMLYFGGANGFNAFDPAQLSQHSVDPGVVLTLFSKLNKPVDSPVPYERIESIKLDYDDDVVTFEFAATDFVAPLQNQYQHLLEGFDRGWVNAGNENRITYTNLDPGHYTLRVRAANSDGVWSSKEIALPFHVTPPPWLTWWAYVIYGLILAAAVYLMIYTQRRRLAREADYSRRLETEVSDRTQELADRNDELEVANQRLHEASHTDALTGLRNRRYLFDEIVRDIHQVQRQFDTGPNGRRSSDNHDAVFIVVDLDGFKPVNDVLGHLAGDKLLMKVRDALTNACRSSDVVIRWGGDEFLVVARETSRADATRLVERIRESIELCSVELDNGHIARTTCSLGFAAYPFIKDRPELFDWEQVLGVADVAMYRAKRQRNSFCGIYGLSWDADANSLLAEIKRDAAAKAEEGAILITDASDIVAKQTA